MADNSQWRLPALDDKQKEWVIDARALGMSYDEITAHFQEMFSEFVAEANIPEDIFPKLFTYRTKHMLYSESSSASCVLEAKQFGEIPINTNAIPLVNPHIRLMAYQRMFDELPLREVVREAEVEGEVVPVYSNNAPVKLSILKEIEKLLERYGLSPTLKSSTGGTSAPSGSVTTVKVVDSSELFGEGDEEDVD